jgi:putative heme-binding domain-containing protein
MNHFMATALFALLTCTVALGADDPFAENVRSTPPRTPDEQRKLFHLPPGFEIQLVAAEPDIAKPMNLAFDAKGRLWVSSTNLYPVPAKSPPAKRDTIKVIELGDDGRATKISTFVDGLNIPIGLLPLGDGRSVFAYDINNIRLHTDTDGDGKADRQEVLYSGFGYERDTHGMASNFRRGFDGWIYACHGFNNLSDIADRSGNVVHLRSGNTFRMRPDGSRVEAFTIGQINPFGLCFDPLGNIYTSDSHSKPIYQLLRGGRYEAFDRDTNDGLGLAPPMMQHSHNSSAIAGSVFYAAEQFPEEFRGNVFVGNVVTSRINRDKLEYHGSTPRAIEQPDFLTCDDPWFRPVNTVLGPDGALYVADFYNRVIGHYEVGLDHPGRDYQRGRIWRIVYKGDAGQAPPPSRYDFSTADAPQLIEKLHDPNLTRRMLAMNELSDRIGADAIGPALLAAGPGSTYQKIHGLWVLFRLRALELGTVATAVKDPDPAVRVHVMRILAESGNWPDAYHMLAIDGLADADSLVQRCAADALGQHPDVMHVRPLLALRHVVPAEDTHLLYTVRMALRNQLSRPGTLDAVLSGDPLSPQDMQALIDVAGAVPTPEAAAFLLEHLDAVAKDKAAMVQTLRHAVRYADGRVIEPLVGVLQTRFAGDLDLQIELFTAVRKAAGERGEALPDLAKQWGAELATLALRPPAPTEQAWTAVAGDSASPWVLEQRKSTDGDDKSLFFGSLPLGEQLTGTIRSGPFSIPPKLSMFVAGHNGHPNSPDHRRNVLRLRSAANDAVLAEGHPPRHDVAHPVVWDLKEHAGQEGYLEVVDGDAGTAYAWLAFGRLDPPVAPLPVVSPAMIQQRRQAAAQIAGELSLRPMAGQLHELLRDSGAHVDTRAAAAVALAKVNGDSFAAAAAKVIEDPQQPAALREKVAAALGDVKSDAARAALINGFRTAPARLQTALASALAATPEGSAALMKSIAEGAAPATLLQQPAIVNRLAAAKIPDLEATIGRLTRGLPAPQEQVQKLIGASRAAFAKAGGSAENGAKIYAKNCIQCHQLGGQGGLVGPQLDGIANRGVERVIEDILDPNRNVDPAFRYSNIVLNDTKLITGLQRREDGEMLVFMDTTGKEVSVPKAQIKQRIESKLSVMPGNFGEIIPPGDFNDLMAYLLAPPKN